jgi:hypothetical protein
VPAYRIYELHARGRVMRPARVLIRENDTETRKLSGRSNLRSTDAMSRLWRALVSSLGYIATAEDRSWTGVGSPCTRVRSTGLLA